LVAVVDMDAPEGSPAAADASLRTMVQLLKTIFDECILAGFSQREAMELTSLTLQRFLGQAMEK